MTSRPRSLGAPVLDLGAFAARATARSSHAFTLADLADEAAGGHPSQRWTLPRVESGVWSGFYESDSVARFLVVRAVAGLKGGSWSGGPNVTLALTITDGTNVANTLVEGIPDGLRGEALSAPPSAEASRLRGVGRSRWVLDLDTLRGVLSAATRWRFELTTVATSAYLESFVVEEAPRFIIDTGDTYGQLPEDYLPRAFVVDGDHGLQRIGATLEAAYDLSLATYHSMARDEGDPWTTTSTSFAAMTADSEPGGAAIRYESRARVLRGSTRDRVRFALRYRTVGMTPGDTASVRLNTGASGSPFVAVLPNTSGAWTDCSTKTAYLDTSDPSRLDTLTWEAKTDSGTLEVSARTVWRHPSLT